jgi:hypothetical protein
MRKWKRPLVVALILRAVSVSAEELTDEEMRELGATDAQIRMLRGIDPMPQRGPQTAPEFLAAGDSSSSALHHVVASGSEWGLNLAREIMLRDEQIEAVWPDSAVFKGLQASPSQEGLDLLRDAIVERYSANAPRGTSSRMAWADPRWKDSRMTWARIFERLHGAASAEKAVRGVENLDLSPEERALHLLVLGILPREKSFDTHGAYREHLDSPHVELQRAAVLVARALWDYEVVEVLADLAFSSSDIKVRFYANQSALRMFLEGPDRSVDRRVSQGLPWRTSAHDRRRYHEMMSRRDEWQRENYRLVMGEEPPPDGASAPSPWSREAAGSDGSEGPVWSRGAPPEGEARR